MRARKAEFEKARARVVLVGMGSPPECAAFLKRFAVPFQMIADPQQALYRRFHLGRVSTLGIFSPTTAIKGLAALARGSGIGKPIGDVLQLPGVFIIDSDGRIVFTHKPAGPADYADLDTVLTTLARSAGSKS